jgi:hypothetical protein
VDAAWYRDRTVAREVVDELVATGRAARVFRLLPVNPGRPVDASSLQRLALGGRAISAIAMKRIIHDSDSIPLFIEELARTAADSREIDSQRSSGPEIESSVPASLRDALMARLDRTPQARAVAQMAAAVGRELLRRLDDAVAGACEQVGQVLIRRRVPSAIGSAECPDKQPNPPF